jgi:uncharacterized protein
MPESALPAIPTAACRRKPRLQDLRPGESLCTHCAAKCCRYFALAIDKPADWEDFDFIRWYLAHEQTAVFVEDADWYLLVQNRCKHLRDDHLCGIYANRPQICRDYATKDCEYDDRWTYEQFLETSEQVQEYAEAVLGPRPGETFRSAKPPAVS